jgi:hypothetical protein
MADNVKLEPYEHERWRYDVQTYYPLAYIQDDSNPSSLRERALNKGQLVAFFMRPHSTQNGSGYVRIPQIEVINGA